MVKKFVYDRYSNTFLSHDEEPHAYSEELIESLKVLDVDGDRFIYIEEKTSMFDDENLVFYDPYSSK